MPSLATVNVTLDVQVTVVLQAENATDAELAAHVRRCPEDVKGAILSLLEHSGSHFGEREAGWLDENRVLYAMEVVDADTLDTFMHTVRPVVVA